jgi:hypothetical protein
MFKLKGVEIFSLETIGTGVRVFFTMLIPGLVISAIPFAGPVLYLFMQGWVAANGCIMVRPDFFSVDSLSIGWSIEWRRILFVLPWLPFPILLILYWDTLDISDGWKLLLVIGMPLLTAVIGTGWAVMRVVIVRREIRDAPETSPLHKNKIIKNIILESWSYFKKRWPRLLLLTFLTYGLTKIVSLLLFPEEIIHGDNHGFWILLLGDLYTHIGPSALLMSISGALLQSVIVQARTNYDIGIEDNFMSAMKSVVPKLPVIFLLAALYSVIVGLGLLLAIPGAVAAVWFAFLIMIAVVENKKNIFQIFGRSIEIVKGYYWQLTALAAILLVPDFMISAAEPEPGSIPESLKSITNNAFRITEETVIAISVLFSYLFIVHAYFELTKERVEDEPDTIVDERDENVSGGIDPS